MNKNTINLPTQEELDNGIYLPEMTSEQAERVMKMMEEMGNAPKEEIGQRSPGERGMYEIQRKEMKMDENAKETDHRS